ncbi:hypothetical protein HHI36_003026 [Cryptolaemus montrouzieri]|uniref:Uncharacterized protein n=1 Tax=Cryptolaemus montrouzieri TaxID=559131 RepID=A0ABD2PCR0_9CUCU
MKLQYFSECYYDEDCEDSESANSDTEDDVLESYYIDERKAVSGFFKDPSRTQKCYKPIHKDVIIDSRNKQFHRLGKRSPRRRHLE